MYLRWIWFGTCYRNHTFNTFKIKDDVLLRIKINSVQKPTAGRTQDVERPWNLQFSTFDFRLPCRHTRSWLQHWVYTLRDIIISRSGAAVVYYTGNVKKRQNGLPRSVDGRWPSSLSPPLASSSEETRVRNYVCPAGPASRGEDAEKKVPLTTATTI